MTAKGDRLDFSGQKWVALEDYQSLQAALREALDGWEFWHGDLGPQRQRIAALRAQFLDDHPSKEPS